MSLGFDPQLIVDGDWTEVENTKATPYNAVCQIESAWFDGSETSGTAFFVGRRVLITNAHNVWRSDKPSRYPLHVEVNPGRVGNRKPFGSAKATVYWVPWQWSNGYEGNRNYDIAWLILDDRTLYKRVGYSFGYQTTTDKQLEPWNLHAAGYPEPYDWNFRQFKDHESKDQVASAGSFRHYLDSLPGSSGSPMYAVRDGKRYVVGVNVAESGTNKVYDIATRMTKHYFRDTNYLTTLYP